MLFISYRFVTTPTNCHLPTSFVCPVIFPNSATKSYLIRVSPLDGVTRGGPPSPPLVTPLNERLNALITHGVWVDIILGLQFLLSIVGQTCNCSSGFPQCYFCNATSREQCEREQQLVTCPNTYVSFIGSVISFH